MSSKSGSVIIDILFVINSSIKYIQLSYTSNASSSVKYNASSSASRSSIILVSSPNAFINNWFIVYIIIYCYNFKLKQ